MNQLNRGGLGIILLFILYTLLYMSKMPYGNWLFVVAVISYFLFIHSEKGE